MYQFYKVINRITARENPAKEVPTNTIEKPKKIQIIFLSNVR